MATFACYDITGLICRTGYCPDGQEQYQVTTTAPYYITPADGISDTLDWISGGVITTRVFLSTIASWNSTTLVDDGVSSVTLSNFPNPTKISIAVPAGASPISPMIITDGSFEMTSTHMGTYMVTASSFPYADFTQIITVT